MRTSRFWLPATGALACLVSAAWIVVRPVGPAGGEPPAPRPAPRLVLTTVDGDRVDSDTLAGRVVLMEVWASWCRACVSEIPDLNRLYRERGESDVAVVGVSLDSGDDGDLAALVRDALEITYPVGAAPASFEDDFGPIWALPVTVLLDRSWRIRRTWLGAHPAKGEEIRAAIERLLAEAW